MRSVISSLENGNADDCPVVFQVNEVDNSRLNACVTSDDIINESPFNTTNSDLLPSEHTALKRKFEELEEALENERKKVKGLQQTVRRLKTKVGNLSELLEELKNKYLIDNDALNVLNASCSVNEEFITRQLIKATKSALPKSYSPELRAFAVTLHFYSAKA